MYFFHNSHHCRVLCCGFLLQCLAWAACLELVVVRRFSSCGVVQKTAMGLHCVMPFGHSFPSVVTLRSAIA